MSFEHVFVFHIIYHLLFLTSLFTITYTTYIFLMLIKRQSLRRVGLNSIGHIFIYLHIP